MAIVNLSNDEVEAKINTKVGLQSLRVRGQERLYQNDLAGGKWPDLTKKPGAINQPDPILFPITGPLKPARKLLTKYALADMKTRGKIIRAEDPAYFYAGRLYSLPQHGFARNLELNLLELTPEACTLQLTSNLETKKDYPFDFEYNLTYTLTEDGFIKTHLVKNVDENSLYFSLGDHTALSLDLMADTYELQFNQTETMTIMHPYLGEFPVFDGCLRLSPELVQNGVALKLNNFNATTCDLYKNGKLEMIYDVRAANMFIWTADHDNFLCIEPWNGEAYALNDIANSLKKRTLTKLETDQSYTLNRKMRFPRKSI